MNIYLLVLQWKWWQSVKTEEVQFDIIKVQLDRTFLHFPSVKIYHFFC